MPVSNLCRVPVAAVLVVLAAPRAAAGAGALQCIEPGLRAVAGATTRDDSLALVQQFEQDPPGGAKACGEMLAGYLISMTSTAAEDSWRDRQEGQDLLSAAMRSYGDEPRLYLAMGVLYHHRQSRTDALRMLDRAEERADQSPVPLTPRERALIWYRRGLIRQDMWRDVRSYGALNPTSQGQWHCSYFEETVRDNFTSGTNDHQWLIGFNFACPDQFAENIAQYYEPRDPTRVDELHALEEAFTRALELDPALLPAAEGLLAEYAYLGQWDKVERLARRLEERLPDDYRPHLYLGLALHETARDSLAGPAFGRAFVAMPEEEARRFDDIGLLLTPSQRAWMDSADAAIRQVAANAFWTSLDPLYLTRVNERKLEHRARIVAADLIFSAPTLHERGADTYAGHVWIRYGRPLAIRELQMPTGRVVFWDYGPGPDITFTRGVGFQSYRWTDQGLQYTEGLQQSSPQAYDPGTLFDDLVPLEHQVMRTLDYQGRPQLLIYAGVPAGFAPESEAAFVLMDPHFQPAADWRGKRPETGGLRAELNQVPRGAYSLTVEIWDRAHERLGRLRDTVTTLAITDSSFTVSDLLLAGHIAPGPGGDDPTSRRDLAIEPLYGTSVAADSTVGLYWEMYRFNEPDGRMETEVDLEVLDAGGRSVFARVLRGVGIGGEREPAARVRYESTRPLLNGRAIEWLELDGLAAGQYRIRLRLTDRKTGREVVRERKLVVS